MDVIKLFSSHKVIISESETDTIDAKFIICDFDPNKNDVSLNRDTIDNWKNTLEIKPLVGKVITKRNGKKDFSGHNVKIVEKLDENGKKYQDIEFDTSAFGSFYNVAIETIDDKEHIVASAKVWKRFTQAYEVIKSRATSESGIKTSWEIQVIESHLETINGKEVKVIDKGIFIGHALLGENVEPAYDSSGLLSVATNQNEERDELTIALLNDIYQISTKEEDSNMGKVNTSALTTRDLHQKVREALNPKGWNSNPYYSVWEIYPEDHKILAYDIERDSEDDYLVITYSIADDVVSIGESTETKLSKLISERTNVSISLDLNDTAKLLSEKETEIRQITTQKETAENELASKVEALLSASEKIEQLQSTVDELTPFKEQVEAAQRVVQEQEIAEKKEKLKVIASKGGYITCDEIETSEEIKEMIESLDEKGIKALIAERFIKKLEETPAVIETSSKNEGEASNAKKNINNDETTFDYKVTMSSYLKN